MFGIFNFGHCDLFGICDLLFEILVAETLYLKSMLPENPILAYSKRKIYYSLCRMMAPLSADSARREYKAK